MWVKNGQKKWDVINGRSPREILYSNFRVHLIQTCKPQKIGFLNCRKLMPDNPSKILQTAICYLCINSGALNIRYL